MICKIVRGFKTLVVKKEDWLSFIHVCIFNIALIKIIQISYLLFPNLRIVSGNLNDLPRTSVRFLLNLEVISRFCYCYIFVHISIFFFTSQGAERKTRDEERRKAAKGKTEEFTAVAAPPTAKSKGRCRCFRCLIEAREYTCVFFRSVYGRLKL